MFCCRSYGIHPYGLCWFIYFLFYAWCVYKQVCFGREHTSPMSPFEQKWFLIVSLRNNDVHGDSTDLSRLNCSIGLFSSRGFSCFFYFFLLCATPYSSAGSCLQSMLAQTSSIPGDPGVKCLSCRVSSTCKPLTTQAHSPHSVRHLSVRLPWRTVRRCVGRASAPCLVDSSLQRSQTKCGALKKMWGFSKRAACSFGARPLGRTWNFNTNALTSQPNASTAQ